MKARISSLLVFFLSLQAGAQQLVCNPVYDTTNLIHVTMMVDDARDEAGKADQLRIATQRLIDVIETQCDLILEEAEIDLSNSSRRSSLLTQTIDISRLSSACKTNTKRVLQSQSSELNEQGVSFIEEGACGLQSDFFTGEIFGRGNDLPGF